MLTKYQCLHKLSTIIYLLLTSLAFALPLTSFAKALSWEGQNASFLINISDSTWAKQSYLGSKKHLIYSDSVVFGINGHPLTQEAYRASSLDTQLQLIKELNLKYYRVDVPLDSTGKLHDEARWLELLRKSETNNIKILPVLLNNNWESNNNPASCFALGQALGLNFSRKYSKYFKHYEIGNEDDTKFIPNTVDGSKKSQYDLAKFKLLANYYKGLIQGIKSVDKDAEIIINSSGWLHLGFFQLLTEEQVPYNIIGYHWYSDMGDLVGERLNILDSLDRFNKPIWLTEINRRNGSKKGNYTGNTSFQESKTGELAEFQWLNRYIDQISAHPSVKAFFIYELYDQPAFDDKKGFDAPHEAYFGIVSWLKKYSAYRKKAGFYQLKDKLSKYQFNLRDYVTVLYYEFVGREPTLAEINSALAAIHAYKDSSLAIYKFVRPLILNNSIQEQYLAILNREPSPKELQKWQLLASNSKIIENVIGELISSDEFWELSGSSNLGFINLMYLKLQGREADKAGQDYWLRQLESGSGKKFVMQGILYSDEYLSNYIKNNYEKILLQEFSHSNWMQPYLNNKKDFSQLEYILDLVCSETYWLKAKLYGCQIRNSANCNID